MDENTDVNSSLSQLCETAKTDEVEYMKSLSISQKGTTIIMERTSSEQCVNTYNPTVLKAWKANIDIQFILDAFACVVYVASYMTKNEKGMGELLKQACKEHQDKEVKSVLRQVGSVFLNHREVSAQESVYRLLSMPMKKVSRTIVFINTDPKKSRAVVLKNADQLESLDDDHEDIFQMSIVDRYEHRPTSLENMSLAEFASTYTADYKEKNRDTDDSVPVVFDDPEIQYEKCFPKYIKLKNQKGSMRKRRRPAVIRFRKFNVDKDPSNFYRAKLMLYFPWRNEDNDLLAGYDEYKDHYEVVFKQALEIEAKYSVNVDEIDQAVQSVENGPPQHVWDLLAPGAEHANLEDQGQGFSVERNLQQEDLDANTELFQRAENTSNSRDISYRYELEENREILSPSQYRHMMRTLNTKQRQVVLYHRKWCKTAVSALKNGGKPKPFRLFLSGPGGVGKSDVIQIIHSDTKRLFSLSKGFKPNDITALLTAPTGVAAFNIGGMTVHSALLLRTSMYGKHGDPLTCEKLNTLRSKLETLQLLIVDEISMIGSDMLLNIHRRLCEIKGTSEEDSNMFGNVGILAVGDLYQLPPVLQSNIYDPVNNPLANLHGNLWKDEFVLHELDETMRQRNDQGFAEMLCRIRIGKHTEEDIVLLKTRVIDVADSCHPHDAVHVFACNKDVDEWNVKKLLEVEPDSHNRMLVTAIDDKNDITGLIDLQNPGSQKKRSETGGLHKVLKLAVGARVMLTYNIDVSDGLVNGVIGTVAGVERDTTGKFTAIFVRFDHPEVGKATLASSQWEKKYPQAVPIHRQEGKFEKSGKKGAQVSRYQFPLTLAWAVTIHKCQGLTLDNIVVSMKGAKRFGNGQAYVAFSRVKSLNNLFITDFDKVGIKSNKKIPTEMQDMRLLDLTECTTVTVTNITIGHLINVHYFIEKIKDMQTDNEKKLFKRTDVICFCETYLQDHHSFNHFLNEHSYTAFRSDAQQTSQHARMHGVMICAKSETNPTELESIAVQGLESKTVLLNKDTCRLVVCTLYRSPSTLLANFLIHMESLLLMLPLNVPTVILGDFNVNILDSPPTSLTNLMTSYGFKQLVQEPTTDSRTLIDHIYVNKLPHGFTDTTVEVEDIYYSDHDAVILTIT
ncbi:uncharacterized protein [Antedon mediterranea]|uniref:uncharacterized protein n=1 Tax=Antedon mediterranea TaxID=105859 RepID=UPI003AF87F88